METRPKVPIIETYSQARGALEYLVERGEPLVLEGIVLGHDHLTHLLAIMERHPLPRMTGQVKKAGIRTGEEPILGWMKGKIVLLNRRLNFIGREQIGKVAPLLIDKLSLVEATPRTYLRREATPKELILDISTLQEAQAWFELSEARSD